MSTFTPLQYKAAKPTSSIQKRPSVLQSSRGIEPPKVSFVSEPEAAPDRQLAPSFSLARIPIDASAKPPGNTFEDQRGNNTGLPNKLKAGIERLSGYSLDDVKVHFNSSKPAQLEALAYTQGIDIHVGPGQERHLAHEAWHVVQQKQGRVQPSLQANGEEINHDQKLEREADLMGSKATCGKIVDGLHMLFEETGTKHARSNLPAFLPIAPIQRRVRRERTGKNKGKFFSTEANQWFDNEQDAIEADNRAMQERQQREQQEAQDRQARKQERLERDIEPEDKAKWGIDQMTQVAHNRPRADKYARHSTTAVGIPITHEGFGTPIISQQRNEPSTVQELQQQLTDPTKRTQVRDPDLAAKLPEPTEFQAPEVIPSLESGQHADPFAVYKAFAGNFEETGELAPAVLLGVSKGRCDDCDDAVDDFPVINDEGYTLGESTKKWAHARRVNAQEEVSEEEASEEEKEKKVERPDEMDIEKPSKKRK